MRLRLLPPSPQLGWLPYPWLAFLGFFIVGMFAAPVTISSTTLNIAGLLLFLFVYFRAFWIDDGSRLLIPIGVCTFLGVGFSMVNPGAAVFFHYASFFSGRLGRWQYSVFSIVSILLVIVLSWHFFDHGLGYLLTAGLVSAALGAMSIQIYEADKIQRRLARSEAEIEQLATIAERERIARDLHDVVGHTLSVITMKAELAQRVMDAEPERSRQELSEIENVARTALDEVRQTITGYKHLGMRTEFANVQKSLQSANIDTHFEPPPESIAVSAEHESALIMVLKEASTNIIRHSKARNCSIALEDSGSGVVLTVHDDGIGYKEQMGNGVTGMTERIVSLGGTLSISNRSGTLVTATVPLLRC